MVKFQHPLPKMLKMQVETGGRLESVCSETSLVVQGLKLCTPNAGAMFHPDQGTGSHMLQLSATAKPN